MSHSISILVCLPVQLWCLRWSLDDTLLIVSINVVLESQPALSTMDKVFFFTWCHLLERQLRTSEIQRRRLNVTALAFWSMLESFLWSRIFSFKLDSIWSLSCSTEADFKTSGSGICTLLESTGRSYAMLYSPWIWRQLAVGLRHSLQLHENVWNSPVCIAVQSTLLRSCGEAHSLSSRSSFATLDFAPAWDNLMDTNNFLWSAEDPFGSKRHMCIDWQCMPVTICKVSDV